MWCANQQQMRQSMPVLAQEPPVLVDWLPWNHTFGGNHNFGLTIYNGGTLYIDDGKPVPALMPESPDLHGSMFTSNGENGMIITFWMCESCAIPLGPVQGPIDIDDPTTRV